MSSEQGSSGIELPPQLRARSAALANLIDRHALPIYGIFIAGFLCLFCAAARLLTLEADEAWILLSTAHAFGVSVPATSSLGPTVTTGGPHLLIHGLIALATMDVMVHRAVSVIASAALLWLVYRALRATGSQPGFAAAGTALFATVPGFILQAGLATGEVIATALLIAAAIHWAWRGAASLRAAIVTGLLLGAAIAARVNLAAAALALLAYVLLTRPQNIAVTRRAIAAAFIALVVACVCITIYYKAGEIPARAGNRAYLAMSTGLDGRKTFGKMLQGIEIANLHLPLLLVVALIGAWLNGLPQGPDPRAQRSSDLCGLLLFMGLAMLLAWILIAPIPHLRYLWPAIACMWLSIVVLLLQYWRIARRTALRLMLHALVVVACIYGLMTGVISLANGESLSLAFEAIGASPRSPLRPSQSFRAAADQRAVARYMTAQPSDARFFAPKVEVAYPLTFLSRRTVEPMDALPAEGLRFVLISPTDFTVWQPSVAFEYWLKHDAELVFSSGNYALFLVRSGRELQPDTRPIGQNRLF